MTAYYNEHDPYAAEWLRNLMATGHIAAGEVDERSIEDVEPSDLRGFVQCHFFAGIGVWSHALRRAEWSDERPIWTGSCPCQPFSAAGQRGGVADERHLWPAFFHLIDVLRPETVVGEQVASKDGLNWLDLVQADMEGAGYAFGAHDLCAAGFGGAHIRQRLYFVGVDNSPGARCFGPIGGTESDSRYEARLRLLGEGCANGRLADAIEGRRSGASRSSPAQEQRAAELRGVGGLADADGRNASAEGLQRSRQHGQQPQDGRIGGLADASSESRQQDARSARSDEAANGREGRVGSEPGSDNGYPGDGEDRYACAPLLGRSPADWLYCRDGKWRPVEPGTFPLAHAAPARVGRLRAYGNALDAETATEFVKAVDHALTWQELLAA